ncbi:SU10 major capsid protein [Agrobacterium pusense]|uniref:SU10 major capsid protein n=1 Tax=Agrobacterium pusense TaxID=648995 RepID=UPI0022B8E136|nr:DUF5309 family protein [Agrobacterium pusense]MCZ7926188.1 DUF5309 family protein [Agrobacterium pusense]
MATFTTHDVKHIREDLADVISDISPEDTPFTTLIGSTKATATRHQYMSDSLAPANKDNAAVDGADAVSATLNGPERFANYTQIFTKTVKVSGTLQAVNTAGTKNELARQLTKGGKEMKRDKESAFLSGNVSNPGSGSVASKLGGALSWLNTNMYGYSSATGASDLTFDKVTDFGYDATTGVTKANPALLSTDTIVGGTQVVPFYGLREDDFNEMLSACWSAGGEPDKILVGGGLKRFISQNFTGGATKYQKMDKDQTLFAGVDIYAGDFGMYSIIPSHFISPNVVFAFDPKLWAEATLRGYSKSELGKSGDSTQYQLTYEGTLESRNEAGSGAIVGIIPTAANPAGGTIPKIPA